MKMELGFNLQKHVHGDLHDDSKSISRENLENVILDVYNDDVDVVSMFGKDGIKVDNIEDNLEKTMMVWDMYNDNVGVVSVFGKDNFRVDDIEKRFGDQRCR